MPIRRTKYEVLADLDQYIRKREDDLRRMRFMKNKGCSVKDTLLLMHERCTAKLNMLHRKLSLIQSLDQQSELKHIIEQVLRYRNHTTDCLKE